MMALKSICLVAAALLATAPARAQTELANPAGDWSPGTTQVIFPASIGDYRRTQIIEYASDNWGVSYKPTSTDGKFRQVVSVYLYTRMGNSCEDEFEGTKAALEDGRPDEVKLFDRPARSPLGGSNDAMIARYNFKLDPGSGPKAATSDAYLYCHPSSSWWVKVRSTWLSVENLEGGAEQVMRGIGWPREIAD